MRRIDHAAPTTENYQRHYWETAWTGQDLPRMRRQLRREAILPVARRVFPAGARLLEAGCGSGKYCLALSEAGYDVVGLDFAVVGLRSLREAAPGVPAVMGSVVQMPFADASFDGALSLGVVEHFESGPEPAIAELARVIRPGGTLLLTVPFQHLLWDLNDRFWPDGPLRGENGGGHAGRVFYQYLFREDEMHAHLERAGFRVGEVRYIGKQRGLRDFYPLAEPEGNSTVAARRPHPSAGGGRRWKTLIKSRAPAVAERLRDWQINLLENVLPGRLCAHMVLYVASR